MKESTSEKVIEIPAIMSEYKKYVILIIHSILIHIGNYYILKLTIAQLNLFAENLFFRYIIFSTLLLIISIIISPCFKINSNEASNDESNDEPNEGLNEDFFEAEDRHRNRIFRGERLFFQVFPDEGFFELEHNGYRF